jgi:hypothetical protein
MGKSLNKRTTAATCSHLKHTPGKVLLKYLLPLLQNIRHFSELKKPTKTSYFVVRR